MPDGGIPGSAVAGAFFHWAWAGNPVQPDWVKAGHDVVAAFPNAPSGMNCAVEPQPIADLWYDAVHKPTGFHHVHIMLGTWNDELECPL